MTASWQQVPVNGGGFVTGMDVASDGTMVCRVDVFGAYLNTSSTAPAWSLLTNTTSLPASAWGFSGAGYTGSYVTPVGVYEIRIAASNTSDFYMMMNGKMYVTTNKGATWTLMTGFPSISWGANENDSYRLNQKKLGIDPASADVVYVGTPTNGLYVTDNGTSGAAATFAAVSSVPTSTAGGMTGICFDPSSGTTGGKTNRIYVCSYGHGVYTSGDAGSTWSLITGSPTVVYDALVESGVLYVATTSGIKSWNGTSWSTYLSDGSGVSTLAFNPLTSGMVGCMGNGGGNLNYTSGAGFQGPYFFSGLNPNNPPSDAPWLADTKPGYPTYGSQTGNNWVASACWFDPTTANRFWIAWGYGVSYIDLPATAPNSNTAMTFVTACDGIQNTVATDCMSPLVPSGSRIFIAAEDVQFWRYGNLADSPTSAEHGTGTSQYGARVELACWSMDWSQSSANVGAALIFWNGQNASAFTTNNGTSWTQFPTAPTAHNGGCITCVDSTHFIAIDANSSSGTVYTTDGGTTWTASTGLPTTGWPNDLFNNPQILCNDAGGTVYAYSNGNGLYSSTDKGASFSLVNSQNLLSGSWGTTGYDNPHLSAVPGNSGYLVFSPGYTNAPLPQGAPLYLSTNGGTTWTAVAGVQDVWCHGWGPIATGKTYPTLWVVGWIKVGSVYKYGIGRSQDLGSTWTWFEDYPAGNYDQPRCITGSVVNANTVLVGFQGSGYWYGKGL